jgi:hypothetical protein
LVKRINFKNISSKQQNAELSEIKKPPFLLVSKVQCIRQFLTMLAAI